MGPINSKLKEVLVSVLPVTILVVILHFTLTPLGSPVLLRFLLGSLWIIIGLTLFLLGVDISISPIGNVMGSTISRKNKLWIVIAAGLVLGFLISIAEPDLHILAGQVDSVSSGIVPKIGVIVVVSIGVAAMVVLGLIRILYNIPLYKIMTILYGIVLILGFFTTSEFLAISFDASGATTGALTVPFILALAAGTSGLKKDSKASEKDSFGLVGIASVGAIIAVMIMSILAGVEEITGDLDVSSTESTSIIQPFLDKLPQVALEIFLALAPIVFLFLVFQPISFKMSFRQIRRVMFGVLFTYVGLILFLTGVSSGFMIVGSKVGYILAALDNKAFLVIVGFVLGLLIVLAEPAVSVLTHQIADVTKGYVPRKLVMYTLALGVGLAVALSMVKILLPELHLWHFLLPGYIIAILLMYIVPKIFVGIAFDAGGVASGPMTATFILAFAQGAAEAIEGSNVMIDGFGIIAMVAMTPLITLQLLGLIFKLKSRKEGV